MRRGRRRCAPGSARMRACMPFSKTSRKVFGRALPRFVPKMCAPTRWFSSKTRILIISEIDLPRLDTKPAKSPRMIDFLHFPTFFQISKRGPSRFCASRPWFHPFCSGRQQTVPHARDFRTHAHSIFPPKHHLSPQGAISSVSPDRLLSITFLHPATAQ